MFELQRLNGGQTSGMDLIRTHTGDYRSPSYRTDDLQTTVNAASQDTPVRGNSYLPTLVTLHMTRRALIGNALGTVAASSTPAYK